MNDPTDLQLAAGGADSINESINNATGIVQGLGISIVTLVFVALGVMMLFGAFGEGGKLRQHLGKVAIATIGALVIGGGAIIGPMFVNLGSDVPKRNTSVNQNSGVN